MSVVEVSSSPAACSGLKWRQGYRRLLGGVRGLMNCSVLRASTSAMWPLAATGTMVLNVESDAGLAGCPGRGVVAVGRGRRVQVCTSRSGRPRGKPAAYSRRCCRSRAGHRAEIITHFTTGRVSNGGAEAINGVIEKTAASARLLQLQQLPDPDPARRGRITPLPPMPKNHTRTMLKCEGPQFAPATTSTSSSTCGCRGCGWLDRIIGPAVLPGIGRRFAASTSRVRGSSRIQAHRP
jgi:hypothetical protein